MRKTIRHELAIGLRRALRSNDPNLWKFLFYFVAPFLIIVAGIMAVGAFAAFIYSLQL